MTAGSGPLSRTPFAIYDQDLCIWRTSQPSLFEDLAESSPTWPRSGMWDLGRAYEHRTSAHHTGANESSSLLKTPTAQLAVNGGSQHPDKRRGGGHGPTLADEVEHLLGAVADTSDVGHERGGSPRGGRPGPANSDLTAADTEGHGRDARRAEPAGQQRGSDPAVAGAPPVVWGIYEPAIRRWEAVMGRPAPSPVNERGRLCPIFVEWLMGLPEGHVTGVPGLARNAQLKALGNGVVPQQAAHALRLLLDRAGVDAVPVVAGLG